MTKFARILPFLVLFAFARPSLPVCAQTSPSSAQQLLFAGLRSSSGTGDFHAVRTDSAGNLYLLLDQKDGVRVLKIDATASTILAQVHLGASGDAGLSMALDPAGNVYVAGTSTSGALSGSSGAAFPQPADTSVNSFIAKFDSNLNLVFLTFTGSGRTSATSVAATADAVFVTGLIYGNGLPVTPSAILQAPSFGSGQNGFVERFSSDGHSLVYATYLTGGTANTSPSAPQTITSPAAIVADNSDNAYVAGSTIASGYPTLSALVPLIPGATSGFLTKLAPAGDGILFSTFIPGDGVSSLALDPAANNLLLSGSIALGQFPVTTVTMPLVHTTYQVVARMALDGSSVLSSTVVAPGAQSFVRSSPDGGAWVDGSLSMPLLPLSPLSETGTSFAAHLLSDTSQAKVDQIARFGGLSLTNPDYASLPLTLESLAVASNGEPVFAGSVNPTASSQLLSTQTFDLPLENAPTPALPSTVHDALIPPATCTNSSECEGSGAYLARLSSTDGASLAFSTDGAPALLLRNLGTAEATNLQISSSTLTLADDCGGTLAAGQECTVIVRGAATGRVTATADNAISQTVSLANLASSLSASNIVFSPKELDFGIQTSGDSPRTRTITVTNLGSQSAVFPSGLNSNTGATPYSFSEVSSDCTAGGPGSKLLAAGATCHITLGFTASSDASKDGPAAAQWLIGGGYVMLTGYSQAAALSASSSQIDFGTQFYGGLSSPRYLYLSNSSSTAIDHTTVSLPAGSPFTVTDHCPALLNPATVCQIAFAYHAAQSTSTDSVTLPIDGLSILVTGKTIPPTGVNGATANPNLSVTPSSITFSDAVPVTGTSGTTQTVTVLNTGSASFSLALALTGDFTDTTDCGNVLAGNSSCSVVITFAPSAPGTRSGLLSVTAGAGTTPLYVSLTGTGTAILPANNGTLDFGDVPIGQPGVLWYKISQPFTSLSAISSSSDFTALLVEDIGYGHGQPGSSAFLSATTGSCLNCWLGVQFTPSAAGTRTGSLSLSSTSSGYSYTLNLTGTGIPLSGAVLTPLSQSFSNVPVHSSSAPALFTLTNLTGAPISVTTPTLTGDFALAPVNLSGGSDCSGTLAASASCFVQVAFTPTAIGQRTGTLVIQTSNGSATAALTGSATGDPGVSLHPNALVFSNVPGVTATQQTITLANTGSSSIQVGSLSNASASFQTTSNCGSLAPAASCTITVAFTPAASLVSDSLSIPVTTIVGGNPSVTTYTIPLTGGYTTQNSGLQILPATVQYGPASVGTIATERQFSINNLTGKSVSLNLALPRQFALTSAPCSGLAPNASCTFSVRFLPVTNGDSPGTLFAQGIPTDGSTPLTGIGYAEGYGIAQNALTVTGSLSPGRILSFGQVPSGQTVQQVLTLTNTTPGSASDLSTRITIRRITSQWPFLSTTTCGAELAINQSCTVTLTYSPINQAASTGAPPISTDAGMLSIESDAATSPDLINLAGTSTPVVVSAPSNTPPLPAFTASQSSLTFPDTPIGYASAAQTVALSNTGNTVLHITGLSTSADFTTTSDCATLVPGASCNLSIVFTPQVSGQSSGYRSGTVEIASDSSTSLEFLTLLGSATPSTLVFQPNSLNFGVVNLGTTATLPVTITNLGNSAATLNGIAATGDYTATGDCPSGGSLAPNASCTEQVTFKPTQTGIRSGQLTLTSSASSLPLSASLTGVGAQSHLQVAPSTLNFGDIAIGSSSRLALTLSNTGTASISNLQFAISGDYTITSSCSVVLLTPGASCSVTLTFTPTAAGARSGALTISSSDPTSPSTIPLTGNGTPASGPTGSFTLTVDGSTSASATLQSNQTATYTLTVTPVNGFHGTVALSCQQITATQSATCSLQSPSVTLNGSDSQTLTATINTNPPLSSVRSTSSRDLRRTALCLLAPAVLLFWRFRRTLAQRPAPLLLLFLCTTLMWLAGCGGGASSKVASNGASSSATYRYQVTASSAGTQQTQTVTLNLTIP